MRAWIDRGVCPRCGAPAEVVRVPRPWPYYASSAVLLLAFGLLLWGPWQDVSLRTAILVAALTAAGALASWSLHLTKERVRERLGTSASDPEARR